MNACRRFGKIYNTITKENPAINNSFKTMQNFHGQESEIQIWAKTFTIEEIINHGIIGAHRPPPLKYYPPPLNLGPPLIPKLQVPS